VPNAKQQPRRSGPSRSSVRLACLLPRRRRRRTGRVDSYSDYEDLPYARDREINSPRGMLPSSSVLVGARWGLGGRLESSGAANMQ
jgi:hypothetical protein